MQLYQHPTQPGWLIGTVEVERLLNVGHQLILPDGQQVHPLYSYPPNFLDSDLEACKTWALDYINDWADAREDTLDAKLSRSPARAIFLNTEIVQYYNAGRPANPAANVYVMADEMAASREVTLREMLELLFAKWLTARERLSNINAIQDEATTAIEAAATIADIAAILAALP